MAQQSQQKQTVLQKKEKDEKEEEHSKVEDHILRRYDLQEYKGKGAYGIVWKAIDKKSKETVALKKVINQIIRLLKIFDAFHNATDAQRTFREVIFLEQLTKHENIVRLQNVIKAENNKDLYMVFEFMETDLHKVIRANILEPIHKKYIIYQLIKGLKYIHSGELIHRDLKPSNLLINSECKIKIADFGLARSVNSKTQEQNIMTEYVATRWYRAPEILLGSQKYSKSVDIWSVGCILAEMIIGKALFPGTSTENQIQRVIELLGKPKADDLEAISSPIAINFLQHVQGQKKKSIGQMFQNGGEEAIDFIRKCLYYNPQKRMTIEEAILHPYLKEFQGTEEEGVKDSIVETLMDDNFKYSVKEYRDALYMHLNEKKKNDHKHLIIRNLQQLPQSNRQSTDDKATTKSPTKMDGNLSRKKKIEDSYEMDSINESKKNELYNPNPSRILHHKSQSYISTQYPHSKQNLVRKKEHQSQKSQQEIPKQDNIYSISASQSPVNIKRKSIDAYKKTHFPNVESKADENSPIKLIKSNSQSKKSLVSQNNNYFLTGSSQKNLLEQSSKILNKGSNNTSLNKNGLGNVIKSNSNMFAQQKKSQNQLEKSGAMQYQQFIKNQMAITTYANILNQKVRIKK